MGYAARSGTIAAMLAALAVAHISLSAEQPSALPRIVAAMKAPLATRAPLTAVARAGKQWVAVGDYGVVLISENGARWQQAGTVPFDGLLTAVTFVSEKEGWAVGHGGVVLHTTDGGREWTLAAAMPGGPTLLSIWFKDARRGIITGAYGAAFATDDGGRTWKPLTVRAGRDGEIHLNHIFGASDGTLYIAAETGAAFRSTDGGASWTSLQTGASGSLWGGTVLTDGTVLLIGMTGRVLASRDRGESWNALQTGTEQSLTSVVETADGGFLAVGTGGTVLRVEHGLANVRATIRPDRQNLAAVALRPDGRPTFFGQLGVTNDDLDKE
jgi:photosystem II stability/assembly factor-like uncharacterized protein